MVTLRVMVGALLVSAVLTTPAHAAPQADGATRLTVYALDADVPAGSLARLSGRLTDATGQPLSGQPIQLSVVEEASLPTGAITGDAGASEALAPAPDQVPATGAMTVVVRFPGGASALPAETVLSVAVRPAQPVPLVGAPESKPTPTPKPKASKTPAATPTPSPSPAPQPTPEDPLLRSLLWAAGGLLGLMLLLFVIGGIRRRRPRA